MGTTHVISIVEVSMGMTDLIGNGNQQ